MARVLSGFRMTCNFTPAWWALVPVKDQTDVMSQVLATIMKNAPWCAEVSFSWTHPNFQGVCIVPEDVTLDTMMQKRDAVLAEIDKLRPDSVKWP